MKQMVLAIAAFWEMDASVMSKCRDAVPRYVTDIVTFTLHTPVTLAMCHAHINAVMDTDTVSLAMNRIRTSLCPSLARPISHIRARVQVCSFFSPRYPSNTLLRTRLHTLMPRDLSHPPWSIPSIADTTTFASH